MTTELLTGIGLGLILGLLAGLIWFLWWRLGYVRAARRDAVRRSLAVTVGKVFEQLVPYLPDFRFNPKDARFLGTPVDFVVFDGLSDGEVRRVVFVEVKTGGADLSSRERRLRDAVEAGRVEWAVVRVEAGERDG